MSKILLTFKPSSHILGQHKKQFLLKGHSVHEIGSSPVNTKSDERRL